LEFVDPTSSKIRSFKYFDLSNYNVIQTGPLDTNANFKFSFTEFELDNFATNTVNNIINGGK
jgi:hypothetical protein